MDVDIFQLPTMHQQVRPARRRRRVKRFDGNLNLTDALFAAFHVSFFALWPSAFPSRRSYWRPRLWRFRGQNVDPGVLQGGIVETITIDKFADPRNAAIATRWRDRLLWRNRSYLNDRVEELQYIPPLFPAWMWLHGPQHRGKWAQRKLWRTMLAVMGGQQCLVQTPTAAATSIALGDVHYTGGGVRLE